MCILQDTHTYIYICVFCSVMSDDCYPYTNKNSTMLDECRILMKSIARSCPSGISNVRERLKVSPAYRIRPQVCFYIRCCPFSHAYPFYVNLQAIVWL